MSEPLISKEPGSWVVIGDRLEPNLEDPSMAAMTEPAHPVPLLAPSPDPDQSPEDF